MLAAHFCHSRLLFIDKMDCLYSTKSGWHCNGCFPPALASNLHNPPTNGKQGPIPEEMSQTLLIKKSKETWTKYTQPTLLS
jgi:hypothetical protein